MKKLFIFGNGFDCAHDLPTSYLDFRKFLINESQGVKSFYPETYINKDGEVIADRKATSKLLVKLIDETAGDDWGNFEEAMARYNYLDFFEDLDIVEAIESPNDDEMFRVVESRKNLVGDLTKCVVEVKRLFSEWIDQIKLNTTPQKRFLKLFDENSLFLTFNYTDTLEKIYNISGSQICHIHGKHNEEIVVGHGKSINPYEEETNKTFAIADELFNLFNSLKKDVQQCYNRHFSFFQKLRIAGVTDIYSFGWGLSKPDLFYLSEICKEVDTSKTIWHLAEYDEKLGKNRHKQDLIKQDGFNGSFGELIPEGNG